MRGGLAPWQERRVKDLIEAKLYAANLPLAMLAGNAVFRSASFPALSGNPSDLAASLAVAPAVDSSGSLADPEPSLSEVCLSCGSPDQSPFTRVFTGLSGSSRGAWRRSRLNLYWRG